MATPRRPKNADVRSREHLIPDEVERLIKADGQAGRNGHRDSTMILTAYRHGLRIGELVGLRRDQVHFDSGEMHVRRSKLGPQSPGRRAGAEDGPQPPGSTPLAQVSSLILIMGLAVRPTLQIRQR